MAKITKRDEEVIGKCAEEHTDSCDMNLGGLCEGCSFYEERGGVKKE